jgi:hypothetical protein
MGERENGRMGEWENGRMGEWENGRMGEWENGRMGEWENGRFSHAPTLPFFLQRAECVRLTLPDTADTLSVRDPLPTRPCAERPGP